MISRRLLLALICFTSFAERSFGVTNLRIVELKGSAYERGLKHGTELRAEIQKLVALWKDDLQSRFREKPETFITQFFARTRYPEAIKRWTPDLLPEIKGISDGSGINYETIFVYQLVDEYWTRGRITGEHCSSIAVAPSGSSPTIVAQNLDIESFRDGFQTLLRIEYENGLKANIVTFPGFIGACGLNNKGLAVVPNTLDQLKSSDSGLPVACIIRGLLTEFSLASAKTFLQRISHASGQNYLIGDRQQIATFECSATRVEIIESKDTLLHTNHALKNDDYTPEWSRLLKEDASVLNGGSSTTRLKSMTTRFSQLTHRAKVEDVKSTLRSKDSAQFPVCRTNNGSGAFTFASIIMVPGPEPVLQISPGPPDKSEYQLLGF